MKNLLLLFCLAFALGCGGSDGVDKGVFGNSHVEDDPCDFGDIAIPGIEGIYPAEYVNQDSDYWRCVSDTFIDFDARLDPDGDIAVDLDVPGNSPYGMCNPDQAGENMRFEGTWFVVRDQSDFINVFLPEVSEPPLVFEVLNSASDTLSLREDAGGDDVTCSRTQD